MPKLRATRPYSPLKSETALEYGAGAGFFISLSLHKRNSFRSQKVEYSLGMNISCKCPDVAIRHFFVIVNIFDMNRVNMNSLVIATNHVLETCQA